MLAYLQENEAVEDQGVGSLSAVVMIRLKLVLPLRVQLPEHLVPPAVLGVGVALAVAAPRVLGGAQAAGGSAL